MNKGIKLKKGLILFDYRLTQELKKLSYNELIYYRKKVLNNFDRLIAIRIKNGENK